MEYLSIDAEIRVALGKKGNKDTRKAGLIPAVLYGGAENKNLTVKPMAIRDMIYTPDFKIAELTVDGSTHKCFIKDIQFDPVTDEVRHIDFLELVDGQSVKVNIPVRFKGESPGVKTGGAFMTLMRSVKVKTTPENLVEELFIDISELELGSAVRVRDIEVPNNVEIMSVMASPVANLNLRLLRKIKKVKMVKLLQQKKKLQQSKYETSSI